MAELTKEWLLKTIAELEEERDAVPGAVNEDAVNALAAMKLALASLEAEIHSYTFEDDPRPLYTAPPEPVVPDECPVEIRDLLASHSDALFHDGDAQAIWNACRAAMLQGADGNAPAHFRSRPAQSSLSPAQGGNSPVIPDGWVACSERMPEAGDDMIVFTDDIVMSGISYSKKKGFYIQALEYDDDEPVDNVTHWMPLPAAPQHK